MRIKCIANTGAALSPKTCELIAGKWTTADNGSELVFDLTLEKEYPVYAMTFRSGTPWYHVCEDTEMGYPFWHPPDLFQVTDGRISRYLLFSSQKSGAPGQFKTVLAFPEWIIEPSFWERLVQGHARELLIFSRYRELMDLEFRDPNASKAATVLDLEWLMCPECDESWRPTPLDEMVRCPNCRKVFLNPLYRDMRSAGDMELSGPPMETSAQASFPKAGDKPPDFS